MIQIDPTRPFSATFRYIETNFAEVVSRWRLSQNDEEIDAVIGDAETTADVLHHGAASVKCRWEEMVYQDDDGEPHCELVRLAVRGRDGTYRCSYVPEFVFERIAEGDIYPDLLVDRRAVSMDIECRPYRYSSNPWKPSEDHA